MVLLSVRFPHLMERINSRDLCSCLETFPDSSSLKQHTLTHNIDRPNVCYCCMRTFTHAGRLRQHLLVHNVQHECKGCKKKTCKLKQHMLTHTGERRYECNICKKTFRQAGNLRNHMNVIFARRHSSRLFN